MKNIGKKLLTRIIVCVMVCATILGGNLSLVQAAQDTKAKYTPPAETDPFVSNYYVEPINQDAPFFEEILPKIAANIEEYNTHSINPYYDEFPEANNPENFQGLGSTTYANINGKMVTAEAFYRVKNEALHDPNAGLGLLIYQCIQYKLKHPEEDVKIGFSMYRTSATASVCVLPESKYYGYMRSLYGTNYDEHGFVRISYMLTEAARMGIEVTMVNQLPSLSVGEAIVLGLATKIPVLVKIDKFKGRRHGDDMDIVSYFRDIEKKEAEEVKQQEDDLLDMGYDY